MAVRNYSSTAATTTLVSSVTSGSTSLIVTSATGFPLAPFFLTLARGTNTEETVLVTEAVGTTFTVTRGADNTPQAAHVAGTSVEHVFTATDAREANTHNNASSDVHGLSGGAVVASTADIATHAALTTGAHGVVSPAQVMAVAPGMMVDFAGVTAPDLWLLCDGTAVSRTTYADLFAVLGITYGAGDGSTTFNVPDFTDKVARYGTPGATGGADSVTLAEANLPSHTHSSAPHSHSIDHDHEAGTTGEDAHDHALNVRQGDNLNPNSGPWNNNNNRLATSGGGGGTVSNEFNEPVNSDTHSHSFDVPAYSGDSGSTTPAATGSTGSGSAVDITPAYTGANKIIFAGV